MDPKHPTTTATTATTTSVAATDSPDTDGDAETETPFHHSDRIKPFSSFPNGKIHHQQPPSAVVAYRECLKNHAATIGSHALDGCGEFMPPLTCTPLEPAALTCAACGCHRNFHRREHISDVYGYSPHLLLSFSPHDHVSDIKIENPNGRKRFRTKFSLDQKEKMYLFAEKVGWKMQRCDDKLVADFCSEVGIKRGIFKVWMHNNKNTFGKKDKDTPSPTTTTSAGTTTVVTAAVNAAAVAGVCMDSSDGYKNGRVVKREGGNDGGCENGNSSDQENGGGSGGGGGGYGGGDHGGGGGWVHLHGC